jgi:tetratricopeptide (TPR) repeat protein
MPKREWSGLDKVPDRSSGDGAGEAIVLPDLAPDEDEGEVVPPSDTDDSGPEIPYFDQTSVTPRLVSELVELSRQYPGDESVRRAVARAYLALSYRMFTAERYQESLDLAAVAADWDAAPRDVARVSAQSCLELRDLAGAMEWAQSALAFGQDADMYNVLGEVYYLREDMGRAVEAWRQALSMREDPEIRASLEKAMREMQVADGYDRQRLSHFIVKYEGESMEETGRMVLRSLERSYSYLKSTLGFEPAEPVVIILYSRREYAELGGPHWSAGYFDGKVRVPVRGLVSLDKHVEATLRHELTHAFIYARAGDNCPRWLHEGVAEYCEGVRSERFGNVLAQKIDAEGDFSYCVIGQRCDVRYFYPAATSVVEYMLKVRGIGGIRDLLGHLGGGKDIDQALREVTGRDEMGLMNEWQRFMRRRYL